MASSSDENKIKMAESMKLKFDKCWDNVANMNILLYVALVLEPRNKIPYLGYCLGLIYGKGAEQDKKIKKFQELVKTALEELYDSYKLKMDKTSEKKSASKSSSNVVVDENVIDLEDGYQKYLEEKCGRKAHKSDVDIYLGDGVERKVKGDNTYDVLDWWKINSKKFPILSEVAKHVLGIPISTVASDSAFSTSGRVIDKYRSSLTPKTAESFICLQDWLRSSSTDLQESYIHGQQLEDFAENLEKVEDGNTVFIIYYVLF
ncbi:zinc finger BED domain-containing protein RICESLEEPER 2-like [Bidens hawaiensis]|uniref:zinc finger BED domain-containing protein RICESLEEPER 2-like n=1 Tax=Bidens hawaiensis TaxID=980011 RepID=UPI0040492BFF